MKKLENLVWAEIITTIQLEIKNIKGLLENPIWENDKFIEKKESNKKFLELRISRLEIALKEFETQQLEDLLS